MGLADCIDSGSDLLITRLLAFKCPTDATVRVKASAKGKNIVHNSFVLLRRIMEDAKFPLHVFK